MVAAGTEYTLVDEEAVRLLETPKWGTGFDADPDVDEKFAVW